MQLQFVYRLDDSPEFPDFSLINPALSFSFTCTLSLGFLPAAALAGAKRREVIFPGWPAKDSGFLGRHDLWIPVRFTHGRWAACGGWFMKPSPIDHFPLDISVEVGRIRLRGGDLAALTRGAVLPLGNALGSQVHLVYDNRLLARAELVVAGGELAVRLLDDVPAFHEPDSGSHDS
jgi:flagellar motor switch protein FliN/FliY